MIVDLDFRLDPKWANPDGEFSAAEDSVYGVATASCKVSGHVAATSGSGVDPTPDQTPWVGEMDRANLVHGPSQRLGGNGPAFCQGHSQSIGIRCEKPSLTALVDVRETSIPLGWWRFRAGRIVRHSALGRLVWLWCEYAHCVRMGDCV